MPLEICNGTFTRIINTRLPIKGSTEKPFLEWGRITKSLRSPALENEIRVFEE